MGFADTIAAAALREVEAGGAYWRIRNVTTHDLIMVGLPMLARLPSVVEGEVAEVEGKAEAAALMEPGAMMEMVGFQQAIVCAGVLAGRTSPDDAWEPIRIVRAEGDEDRAASPPRLCVESLDADTRNALWGEIMAFSTDNGRLAKAMETFRDGPEHAAGARPNGKKVRPAAVRNRAP